MANNNGSGYGSGGVGSRKLPGQAAYRLGRALGSVGRATERAIGAAGAGRGAVPRAKSYANAFTGVSASGEVRPTHDGVDTVLGYKRLAKDETGAD